MLSKTYAEPCNCETVEEGVTQIFGKSGNKVVKKFRCTSGTRKGRIVAKAATCTAPMNAKKAQTKPRGKTPKKNSKKEKVSAHFHQYTQS